ncbi:hypothetical protein HY256_07190 [Candidatus Sumerlaeota bacterium]|nr:hypothetical protein [Candidatus Sumerlaeota bacterium]
MAATAFLAIAGFVMSAQKTTEANPVEAKLKLSYNNMRVMSVAIEGYFVDWNTYPANAVDAAKGLDSALAIKFPNGNWKVPSPESPALTTPVAYLTHYLPDPYAKEEGRTFAYFYCKSKPTSTKDGSSSGQTEGWVLWSAGPDGDYDLDWKLYNPALANPAQALAGMAYDPTNGAMSNGDLILVKPEIKIEENGRRVLIRK